MSQHTPGPWTEDEMDGRIYITPTDRPCHYVADINSRETDPEGDYPNKRTRRANARLIAAAPEMLYALRALTRYDEFTDPDERSACLERLAAETRALLAKIEGSQGAARRADPESNGEAAHRA